MSLTTALQIATSGMQISQLGLSTVSHNLVNTNTQGYTRQEVQSSAVSYNGFGAGVTLSQIQRVTDAFLETRALGASSDLSYANTKSEYLSSMESSLTNASSSGGLDTLTSNFFSSLNDLSNDPGNSALKRSVIQQAKLLTDTLNSVDADLTTIQQRTDTDIDSELSKVNKALQRINELNQQIAATERGTADGANANDLKDERDRQIATLAESMKLNVVQTSSGSTLRISTEDGRRLVDESGYVQLIRTSGTPYQGISMQNIKVDGTASNTTILLNTSSITSGKIKALVDVRDTIVPNLRAQLDEFTSTLTGELNRVASNGTSYPPQRTLTSASTGSLATTGTDIIAGLSPSPAGASFAISVVDTQGDVVNTTIGGTAITIPGAGPFSLDDLATLINNNASIGNTALGGTSGVTASTGTDTDGNPYIQIQATNSNLRVVLKNISGDALGTLGMNTLFSGTDTGTITVKSSILNDPASLPIAQMNTDGSLSSLNASNALALAQLQDTKLSYSSAGGLSAATATGVGYVSQITSNLAVDVSDAKDRASYADTLNTQTQQAKSGTSGVDMNEELSLMLVYQNSFQASARIINVVSTLFDELINLSR